MTAAGALHISLSANPIAKAEREVVYSGAKRLTTNTGAASIFAPAHNTPASVIFPFTHCSRLVQMPLGLYFSDSL